MVLYVIPNGCENELVLNIISINPNAVANHLEEGTAQFNIGRSHIWIHTIQNQRQNMETGMLQSNKRPQFFLRNSFVKLSNEF